MTKSNGIMSHYVLKVGYYALVLAVTTGALYAVYLMFLPLLTSVLLTLLLDPIVNRIEARGMRRLWAILSVFLALAGIAAAGIYFVIPGLVEQARHFIGNIPEYKSMVLETIAVVQGLADTYLPQLAIPDIAEVIRQRMPGGAGLNLDVVFSHLTGIFSMMSLVLIIPIVTFFLLSDGHLLQKALLKMVPNRYFEMFFLLFHKITMALKLFIRGQLTTATAVGVMTAVFLSPFVPYSIIIGLIAGAGNVIPYLGPIIGFVPAFFVILIHPDGFEVWRLLVVAGLFTMIQTIESMFIYPLAVGRSVDLHPLIVIIGVLVGGQVGGILGMLLAVPVISIARVSIEVLYANLKSYRVI